MSQLFTDEGKKVPVTVLRVRPLAATQLKTAEQDGYQAVQFGFGRQPAKRLAKPQREHAKPAAQAAGLDPEQESFRLFREARLPDSEEAPYAVGDTVDLSVLAVGEKVSVSGRSKGKGFQGGVKRHGFHGDSRSHGTKHTRRAVGSVGATGPQRIFKGRKMPGRMGFNRVTVKNLEVAYIDPEKGVLALKGAVPGKPGEVLEIRADR